MSSPAKPKATQRKRKRPSSDTTAQDGPKAKKQRVRSKRSSPIKRPNPFEADPDENKTLLSFGADTDKILTHAFTPVADERTNAFEIEDAEEREEFLKESATFTDEMVERVAFLHSVVRKKILKGIPCPPREDGTVISKDDAHTFLSKVLTLLWMNHLLLELRIKHEFHRPALPKGQYNIVTFVDDVVRMNYKMETRIKRAIAVAKHSVDTVNRIGDPRLDYYLPCIGSLSGEVDFTKKRKSKMPLRPYWYKIKITNNYRKEHKDAMHGIMHYIAMDEPSDEWEYIESCQIA